MEKYSFVKEVGRGSYGSVWRAINKQSGEVVAIKRLKKRYHSWQECMNLREVRALCKLKHPNIVKLKEVVQENNVLFMVFEYMECNLHQLIKGRKHYFPEAGIKKWCFQIFQGLAYMHQHGYFHRDLKPENLLYNKGMIKIADFGLAREIDSSPPYTKYVVTRWYRAPEVILRSKMYSSKVDMWAMGAIMAELFTLRPLFPGKSEVDEMYKICKVIGSPSEDSWADGLDLARTINYEFPQLHGVPLSVLIPSASEDAISLIRSLCSWDPCKRPTAAQALQHPFFRSCFCIPRHLCSKPVVATIPPLVSTKRSDLKLNSNCTGPQLYTSMSTTGVQYKQEIVTGNANKNDESYLKGSTRQGLYQAVPPGKRIDWTDCGVADTAEKFANMMIAPGKQFVGQQMPPPPMRARVQCGAESKEQFARPICNLIDIVPGKWREYERRQNILRGSVAYEWNMF